MDEIERLKRQVEQLQKALNDRQQLDRPKSPPALIDNLEFIADCARFSEGLLSEQAVRKKYRFTEEAWTALGNDEALIERVELEKTRRIRNGDTKRERAQQHIVAAPDILNTIMSDPKANAKHRIDSAKTLDTLAANGPQAAAEQDRVVIRIDLTAGGGEVLEFNKALAIKPDLNDGEIIDGTPQGAPATITDKSKDDWRW